MKFSSIALIASGMSVAAAWNQNGTIAYTTQVVTALTTYCPAATQVTHNGVTYTVTSATTLTITNCPCTISMPVTMSTSTTPVPVYTSTPPAPYTWSNATATTPVAPVGTVTGTTSTGQPKFTGAASHLSAAGAGVVAVAGLVAALL